MTWRENNLSKRGTHFMGCSHIRNMLLGNRSTIADAQQIKAHLFAIIKIIVSRMSQMLINLC